jgi:hypothetical protein
MANMTDPDRKRLWTRSGNQCAWPACRQELVDSTVVTAPHGLIIGEEAHIVSESDDGPRANTAMSMADRNSYANILLLCGTHHTYIDKEEGIHFSAAILHEMKRTHEAMVAAGQTRTDQSITRENMRALAKEWARLTNVDEWSGWTSWLLDVQPLIKMDLFRELSAAGEWLMARIWPDSYPRTRKAMTNYLRVHADFIQYFSRIGHLDGGDLLISKYQQEISDWDPTRYDRALARFEEETRTVAELTVELTRAANLVCDEVRSEVDDQFRVVEGKLLIIVPQGLGHRKVVPEYSVEERAAELPYPGIEAFGDARISRDFHFPGAGRFKHMGWLPD